MDTVPVERIEDVRRAERGLLADLAGMPDAGVSRPTLCPGWTAGHVLTHLARSADGLRRSVEGARRGEHVPMYDSMEARAADIEAGAGRPAAELADDVSSAAQRLGETWASLGPDEWDRPLRHHRRGEMQVRDTVEFRWFEVEIHHVDLDAGYGPGGWPPPFISLLLSRSVPGVAGRLPDGVALEVHATDRGERWSAGSASPDPVTVSGPSWAIAAWLAGRPGPAASSLSVTGGALPALRPWP